MSEMLDRAVVQARRLPADRQDAIAELILDAMEDERRWDAAFASSPRYLNDSRPKPRRKIAKG